MTAPETVHIEYLPGRTTGTIHRLENGTRTGVMWGPSVEGNWYASRATVGDGNTFKFTEYMHAHAFLTAVINLDNFFTGHMRYSYQHPQGKYRHDHWYHDRADAIREAGADEHVIVGEPCPCPSAKD